jgi:hypothetical protein
MIGKKINQLATELAPESTDLTIIGDPTTGVSKKITIAQLGAIFSGAVSFYDNLAAFPVTGDINVIYCAKDTQKLYLWSGSAYVEVFPSQALLDTYQLRSEKGVSNGYASLDSGGKVPISQLPSSIMEYKGTWNAATNTPTLANGTGDTGDVYICNVAGTVNFGAGAIAFAVGDYVIYSGSIWQRSSGAVGTVTSVAASITGDSLTISGSPVTTSGTLAFAFNGTTAQYIRGNGTLQTFPSLTGFVPYTGATANVDLGTHTLLAAKGTFSSSGSGDTVGITHSSGSGIALNITKGGNGEGLYINKTSGSGNAATIIGTLNATSLVKSGGTSTQFLKADGSVDSNTYITASSLTGYVPYTGATANVNLGDFDLSSRSAYLEGTASYQAGLLIKQRGLYNFVTGAYTQIVADSATDLNIVHNQANTTRRRYSLSVAALQDGDSFQYAVPRASGTIALTSDLAAYLPLAGGTMTGAIIGTTSTFTNAGSGVGVEITNSSTGDGLKINHSSGRALNIASSASGFGIIINNSTASTSAPFTIQKQGSNVITLSDNGAANFAGQLTLGSTITNGTNTFTLPSATGTLALTSALSGYLPLTGGTLTGALSGTSASFSSSVGIGVASSSDRLNVLGTDYNNAAYFLGGSTTGASYGLQIRAGSNSSDYSLLVQSRAGSDYFKIAGTGAATFSSSVTATSLDVISSSGVGSSTASGLARFITAGTTSAISVGQSNSARRLDIFSYAINVTGESFFLSTQSAYSIIFETNAAERMRITSGGNVGIGTANPTDKFVVSNGGANTLHFDVEFSGGASTIYSYNRSTSVYTNLQLQGLNTIFKQGNTESMRITSGGNVLIGTTSDNGSGQLQVNSGIGINGSITNIATGTSTYTQSVWYNDTVNQCLFENARTTNDSAGTGRTVYFTWRGGPAYGGGVQLQHGANAWAAYTSDARLKTIIANVENGVDAVMKLNPVKYKWSKELETSRTVLGFTAQNVGYAIPEAVFASWKDDELGDVLSYYQEYITPYLVKAIQELKQELDTLKNK